MEPLEIINFFQKNTYTQKNTKNTFFLEKFKYSRESQEKKPIENINHIIFLYNLNPFFLDFLFKKENDLNILANQDLYKIFTLLGLRRLGNQLTSISLSTKWKKLPDIYLSESIKKIIKFNKEHPLNISNNLTPMHFSIQPYWLGLDWFSSVWWHAEKSLQENIEHTIQHSPLSNITNYNNIKNNCLPSELNKEISLLIKLNKTEV